MVQLPGRLQLHELLPVQIQLLRTLRRRNSVLFTRRRRRRRLLRRRTPTFISFLPPAHRHDQSVHLCPEHDRVLAQSGAEDAAELLRLIHGQARGRRRRRGGVRDWRARRLRGRVSQHALLELVSPRAHGALPRGPPLPLVALLPGLLLVQVYGPPELDGRHPPVLARLERGAHQRGQAAAVADEVGVQGGGGRRGVLLGMHVCGGRKLLPWG